MTFREEKQFCSELADDLTTSDVLFSRVPLIKNIKCKVGLVHSRDDCIPVCFSLKKHKKNSLL